MHVCVCVWKTRRQTSLQEGSHCLYSNTNAAIGLFEESITERTETMLETFPAQLRPDLTGPRQSWKQGVKREAREVVPGLFHKHIIHNLQCINR